MQIAVKSSLAWAVLTGCMSALAAEAPRAVDFERDIRPIFAAHCHQCHGPKQSQGGLRLHEGRAALEGGDSGAAIVPGDPAASELIKRVTSGDKDQRMPAEGPPLSAAQIVAMEVLCFQCLGRQ